MDPRTKSLFSSIGKTPGHPTLPPVNNIGFINLQEGLTDAERLLHGARLALKDLQDARQAPHPNIRRLRSLRRNRRMGRLQDSEQEYFARHYASNDNTILEGWREYVYEEVSDKINNAVPDSINYLNLIQQDANLGIVDNLAVDGARSAVAATAALRDANNLWYKGLLRKTTRPTGLHHYGNIIRTSIQEIRNHLARAKQLQANALRDDTISSIQGSLEASQHMERGFKFVVTNKLA